MSLLGRKESTVAKAEGWGTLQGPEPSPDELEQGQNFPDNCWVFPQLRIPNGVGHLLGAKHHTADNELLLDPRRQLHCWAWQWWMGATRA